MALEIITRLLIAVLSLISVAYLIYGGWRYARTRNGGDFAALSEVRGGLQVACGGIVVSFCGTAIFGLLSGGGGSLTGLREFTDAFRVITGVASVFGASLLVFGGWKYMKAKREKDGREEIKRIRRSAGQIMFAVFVLAVAGSATVLAGMDLGPFAVLEENSKPLIALSALMAASSLFIVRAILKNEVRVREAAGE